MTAAEEGIFYLVHSLLCLNRLNREAGESALDEASVDDRERVTAFLFWVFLQRKIA